VVAVLCNSVQARPEAIAKVRGAAVAAFLQAGGLGSKLNDVALGVSEACTSAVRHSTGRSANERIEILAWVEDDLFVVQVRDCAPNTTAPGAATTEDHGMQPMTLIAEADVDPRESDGTEIRLAFRMR
jgi:anti-sigma regulatory factor (Ser/Thr protein kinase)